MYSWTGGINDYLGKYGALPTYNAFSQFLSSIGMDPQQFYTAGGGNAEHGNFQDSGWSTAPGDQVGGMGYTFGTRELGDGRIYMDALKDGGLAGSYQVKNADSFMDKVGPYAPLLVLAAGAAAGAMGGAGAAGSGAAGAGGATAADLATLGVGLPTEVGGWTLGAGEMAGGGGLLGGLGSADKAAMFGDAGYGAGMTGAQTTAFDAGLAGGGGGMGGVWDSIKGGVGSASNFMGLSPSQLIGGGLGLLSGLDSTKDQTQSSQFKMDPRMDALVYGQNGLLPMAQQWFQQNQAPNPLMMQGAQQMANFYQDPAYAQGFNQLKNTGMGLLSKGIAGNPFMGG